MEKSVVKVHYYHGREEEPHHEVRLVKASSMDEFGRAVLKILGVSVLDKDSVCQYEGTDGEWIRFSTNLEFSVIPKGKIVRIFKKGSKLCPLCEQPNLCSQSSSCWCQGVKFPKGIFKLLPKDKKNKDCICQNCVLRYIEVHGYE